MLKFSHNKWMYDPTCLFLVVTIFFIMGCDDSDMNMLETQFSEWAENQSSDVFIRESKSGKSVAVSRSSLVQNNDGTLYAEPPGVKEPGVLWLYPGGKKTTSYREALKFLKNQMDDS